MKSPEKTSTANEGRTGIGSGVRNPALRPPGNPDPIHQGADRPMGAVNGKGGVNLSGPYEPVLGWPADAHPDWHTGSGRGVYVESPDRVVAVYGGEVPAFEARGVWGVNIFRDLRFTEINGRLNAGHRHCHEVVVYDRDGSIVDTWDQWQDAFQENDRLQGRRTKSGHINRIRVSRYDPDRHIWMVGLANNGIFKFSNDGSELVMKVDASNVPEEYHPFIYAQDIAFLPNGDFYVAHLHHLMRFSADGTFLGAIGGQGQGRLQFDGIHDVQVHPVTHHLYINDRVNERIQVLDADGAFLDLWEGFQGFYSLRISADGQHIWAGNGFVHKFLKYDLDGRLIPEATWGTFGIAPGAIWGPHWFDTDTDGNLYVAEDYSGRVQKFRPLPDADPDDPQLIGPLAL
jgi:hypothetical protein